MKYSIVSGNTLEDLEIKVNKYLRKGFICSGSMIIMENRYYQSMIRMNVAKRWAEYGGLG